MRFSPPGRPLFVEEVLGDLARRLETRVELGAAPLAYGPRSIQRLLFRASALSADELALLRTASRHQLAPQGATGLLSLTPETAALKELSGHLPAAGCLLAALENAGAPRGPGRLLGIVNVTPDSFSDGGTYLDPQRAVEHGLALIDQGADILDVGGESTRPGARTVRPEVELERVLPVIQALAQDGRAVLSVDTSKASVAAAALDAGARIVNDVTAGRSDPELLPVVAARGAGLILMHMRGTPRDMQRAPRYDDVVREVLAHLRERAYAAWKAGIDPSRIALDPGLGFGKRLEDNLNLMRALPELRSLGLPLCLGVSRKSFLGQISGEERPERRSPETTAAVALGAYLGAELHRVHEVAPARAALNVAQALFPGRES